MSKRTSTPPTEQVDPLSAPRAHRTRMASGAWCCAPLAMVLAVACSGGQAAETATAEPAAEPASATATPTTAAPAPASTAAGEPALVAAAGTAPAPADKAAPKLTSLGSAPVAAGDLRDAYFHWNQATVTVGGYIGSSMSRAFWTPSPSLTAVAEPNAPRFVDCALQQGPTGRIELETPVVVRGTFAGRSFAVPSGEPPRIVLRPCEVVSVGEPFGDGGDPWTLGATPVAADELHGTVFGWQGKRVQVTGYYNGSSHSSASNRIEHDIEDGKGKDAVGCVQEGNAAAPASAVQQREGVIVEGVIAEPVFERVVLHDCRFVNRS